MSMSRCQSHLLGKSILSANEKYEASSRPALNMKRSKTRFKRASYFDGLNCETGPSFYSKVFGPTLDEVIFGCINSVLKLLQKIISCEQEEEVAAQFPVPAPAEAPVGDYRDAATMVSEILQNMGIPPEVATQMVQTSIMTIQEKKPSLASKMLQTSSPEMVSEILETIGLSPELASQIVQTSFVSLVPPDPSLVPMSSKVLQTSLIDVRSGTAQTTPPPSAYSMFMQTSQSAENLAEKSKVTVNEPSSVIMPPSEHPSLQVIAESSIIQPQASVQKQPSVFEDRPPEPPQDKCDCCKCSPCPEMELQSEPKKATKCACCMCSPCLEAEAPEVAKKAGKCTCCKCVSCPEKSGEAILAKKKICICEKEAGESKVAHKKVKMCKCHDCSAPVPVLFESHCICRKPKLKCKCKRAPVDHSSYLTYEKGDNSGSPKCTCSHTSYRIHHF